MGYVATGPVMSRTYERFFLSLALALLNLRAKALAEISRTLAAPVLSRPSKLLREITCLSAGVSRAHASERLRSPMAISSAEGDESVGLKLARKLALVASLLRWLETTCPAIRYNQGNSKPERA